MADTVFFCGQHFSKCLVVTIGLENRIPPEHVIAARGDNFATAAADKKFRFLSRTLTVSIDALGIGGFILEVLNQFPKAVVATLSEEVLAKNV